MFSASFLPGAASLSDGSMHNNIELIVSIAFDFTRCDLKPGNAPGKMIRNMQESTDPDGCQ
jgi:hypothetical protein